MTYFWTLQRDAYNFFCRIGLLGILFGHTNRPFLFVNICRAQLGIFQREFWDSYFLSCWSWRWQKRSFSMSISIHKNQKCSYNLEFIMKIPKTFGKDDALCRTKRHIEWPTNVYSTLCSVKSMSLLQSFWTGLVYNIEMPVCRCLISVDRWKKNPVWGCSRIAIDAPFQAFLPHSTWAYLAYFFFRYDSCTQKHKCTHISWSLS